MLKEKMEKGPLAFKKYEIDSLIYLDYLDDPNEIFTVQSEKGSILLYDLLQEGYFEFIQHLLNKTNSPTFSSTLPKTSYSEDLTPLHIAVNSRSTQMVDEILALAPSDLDLLALRSSHGESTPLHFSASIDCFHILRRFALKASLSILAAVNSKGETYQEILKRNHHYQEKLIKSPASFLDLIPSTPQTARVFSAGAGSSSGSSSENPKKRTQTQEESPSKSARTGSPP